MPEIKCINFAVDGEASSPATDGMTAKAFGDCPDTYPLENGLLELLSPSERRSTLQTLRSK